MLYKVEHGLNLHPPPKFHSITLRWLPPKAARRGLTEGSADPNHKDDLQFDRLFQALLRRA
jgi:hypothetical protein